LDLGTGPGAGGAPTYRYADALRLAEAALASIPTTTRAGAPGVLCGPLSAFRGLPLAAVAFVGFGEGIFPQRASEDPLDLRRGERRPGDILTDDRDRAAFLELFCAVETAIALSWPATDATSGDPLPPSPLLAPFERALLADPSAQLPLSSPVPHRQGRFRADELPRREILEPAWQQLQPEDLSPEAIRSADARALGEVLRSAEEDLPLALHHAPLLEPAREAAQKLLHLPSFPPIVREGAAAAPLAIADLVAYVRCPVQGAARARLRLRLEEVDDDGRDGDPLEFEAFRLDNLVVEALFAGPGDVAATTALFRARVEADRVASRLPTAPYASARIEKAEAELGPLIARFRGDGAPITFFELGASRGGRDGREARPAQPCGGRLLQGALPPVIDGAIILPGKPRKNPDDIVKNLTAFRIAELVVARAILIACFQEPVTAVRVLALGEDLTAKGDTQPLPEWDFYEAELFLQDLIGHASAPIRPRFAPLEAFVNGARSVRAFEEYRETSSRFPPYAAKGPVPGWRDWPVPEEDDLARELDERLGVHAALIRDKEFPG
jgi:hypothetical protein